MADPEETMRQEDVPPDERPRRPPPIIDGEAVEVDADGRPTRSPSAARRLLTRMSGVLPPRLLAAIAAACILAVVAASSLWVYLASDGNEAPRSAAATRTPVRDDATSRVPAAAAVVQAPPASSEKMADKASDTRDLENRVAAAETALASLGERIGAIERTVRDAAASARAAAERADKVAGQLDDAKKNGDEQEAAQQLDRGVMDDLASRIKALESRQMTVRQIQDRLDRVANAAGAPDKAVRVAVGAAALRNAVERERPFVAELAAARSIGLDDSTLASLEAFAATGLPTRNELFRELSALLPELRRASAPPGQDLGYLDRLQASAVRMLNIRPVKDEPGDDPPTILSRIEFKMIQQDVDAIIAELDKLPAQGKELAQAWRRKAAARRDAIEASRLLAIGALAKLGEPATNGSFPP